VTEFFTNLVTPKDAAKVELDVGFKKLIGGDGWNGRIHFEI